MAIKRRANEKISVSIILRDLNGHKDFSGVRCYNRHVALKVLRLYCEIAFDKAHKGEVVYLPSNFGELRVVKKPNKYNELKRWGALIDKPVKLAPHRMGYSYQHVIDSPLMKSQHYNFTTSKKQTKKLHKILLETTIDFETRHYLYPKKPWLSENSFRSKSSSKT